MAAQQHEALEFKDNALHPIPAQSRGALPARPQGAGWVNKTHNGEQFKAKKIGNKVR